MYRIGLKTGLGLASDFSATIFVADLATEVFWRFVKDLGTKGK